MVLSRLLGPQECQICQQAHFLTWRSMSLMLQEAIQPTAHLQLSCPRPLISLYVSIWAFPLDLWYPRPPFRAWAQGTGDAGGYNAPGLPNVVGEWSNFNVPIISVPAPLPSGAIRLSNSANVNSVLTIGGTGYVWDGMSLEASRSNFIYGGSDTVMPASVNLPVILYLGIPA